MSPCVAPISDTLPCLEALNRRLLEAKIRKTSGFRPEVKFVTGSLAPDPSDFNLKAPRLYDHQRSERHTLQATMSSTVIDAAKNAKTSALVNECILFFA